MTLFTQETYSGKMLDLQNPLTVQICIKDIANALSKVCRFNGQIRDFYSVAEHSMWVAELVPERLRLQALMHDASEAYICDIPTPMKNLLGDSYRDIENRLQEVIGRATGVEGLNSLDQLVKNADAVMLIAERDFLRPMRLHDWGERENVLRIPNWRPMGIHHIDIAKKFLAKYKEYGGTQPIN